MPIVIASSFADPGDVAQYKKAIAQGKTEAEALKVGDAPFHQKTGWPNWDPVTAHGERR